jgi:hypothetical protein
MAKKITPPEKALLDKIMIQRLCVDGPDATWNGKPGITLTFNEARAELTKEYERIEK